MKKIIASLAVIALVLGVTGFYATNSALAKGPKNSIQASFAKGIVKKSGIITGKVSSVASSSLNITVKKATYIVSVSSTPVIVNRVWDKINFSDIKVGDDLQIAGPISSSTTIEATLIIDNSLPPVVERNLVGVVKSVASSTLVLLVKNQEYALNISPTSLLFDNTWGKINFSDIKVGNALATFGSANGTSINAKMVRDLSFPVSVSSTSSKSDVENEVDDD